MVKCLSHLKLTFHKRDLCNQHTPSCHNKMYGMFELPRLKQACWLVFPFRYTVLKQLCDKGLPLQNYPINQNHFCTTALDPSGYGRKKHHPVAELILVFYGHSRGDNLILQVNNYGTHILP